MAQKVAGSNPVTYPSIPLSPSGEWGNALMGNPNVLLLDEPSEGLDSATEARLVASLRAWLSETGKGLVLVSHRPAMAALAHLVVDL